MRGALRGRWDTAAGDRIRALSGRWAAAGDEVIRALVGRGRSGVAA